MIKVRWFLLIGLLGVPLFCVYPQFTPKHTGVYGTYHSLYVRDDFLILYSGNSYPAFFGFHYTQEFADLDRMFSNPGIHFAATAERLNLHINRVWAVEVGVNERPHVTIPRGVNTIYISPGYVHFTRPYLFVLRV